MDYVKARGERSPKVCQIKETEMAPGAHAVQRKLSLVQRSIRKHYPGEHGLAIVVNGVEKAAAFEVT